MTDKTAIIVNDLVKTESSNVDKIAYQESTKKAFVLFKNGGLYEYNNVEKEDYDKLKQSESVGKHLRAVFLKAGYEFSKLENTELFYPVLTTDLLEEAAKKAEEDFGKDSYSLAMEEYNDQ